VSGTAPVFGECRRDGCDEPVLPWLGPDFCGVACRYAHHREYPASQPDTTGPAGQPGQLDQLDQPAPASQPGQPAPAPRCGWLARLLGRAPLA
jgi:hypothetical protein